MDSTKKPNSKNLTPVRDPLTGGIHSGGDLSFRDYVEIFGDDLRPVLEDKILSLNEEIEHLQELKEAKTEALQRKFERENLLGRGFSKWFIRYWLKLTTLMKLELSIIRKKRELRKILTAYNFTHPFKETKELDVEGAKLVPVESFYQGKLRRVGKRLVGLCPFHNEKSPSFTIFTETNSYHCFGCKESGDAINFVIRTTGLSFPEAVRRLGG
jgi:hypothetical protein